MTFETKYTPLPEGHWTLSSTSGQTGSWFVYLNTDATHVGSPEDCRRSGRRSQAYTCHSAAPQHWPCNGTDLPPCQGRVRCGCRTSLHSESRLGHSHKLWDRQVGGSLIKILIFIKFNGCSFFNGSAKITIHRCDIFVCLEVVA